MIYLCALHLTCPHFTVNSHSFELLDIFWKDNRENWYVCPEEGLPCNEFYICKSTYFTGFVIFSDFYPRDYRVQLWYMNEMSVFKKICHHTVPSNPILLKQDRWLQPKYIIYINQRIQGFRSLKYPSVCNTSLHSVL